ncbi:MAG: 4-oxalocrotonate tautomerase [Deltaproteobacteria bacterium]|nr:MAG: 4-oxalocrotonate tautomerase [Deltaproteobacteria bacterium]
MPIVNIDWVERSVEVKRELSKKITDAVVEVAGCPAEAVTIIYTDHPKSDVAKAGKLLCD